MKLIVIYLRRINVCFGLDKWLFLDNIREFGGVSEVECCW